MLGEAHGDQTCKMVPYRRLLRGCNTKTLLLLLLFVWSMCTILTTTDNYRHGVTPADTEPYVTPVAPGKQASRCRSKQSQFSMLDPHHTKELHQDRSGISAAIVIWCNPKSTFTFRHYLSLVSLMKVLKPDEIRFVYNSPPLQDDSGYHQWLEKFGEEYPFLRIEKQRSSCRRDVPNRDWILSTLSAKRGGLVLNIDVILKPMLWDFATTEFEALEISNVAGVTELFSMSRTFSSKMYKRTHTGLSYFHNQSAMNEIKILSPCAQVTHLPDIDFVNKSSTSVHCLNTVEWGDDLYPKIIKECSGKVCRYLQFLAYGYDHVICDGKQSPLDTSVAAPNIVHYIHFGRFNLDFMCYLSILSFIYIQKVDKVYIHCDTEPEGNFWKKLVKMDRDKIQIVHRTNPHLVFNQSIAVVQHMADIAKADIAFKYGGIMTDPDVIIVQKLDNSWFHNQAVVGLDIGTIFPFPDILNIGIFICKPGVKFTKLWIESMKEFNDTDWLWNSGKLTYKITEKDPRVALIEPRLQVICYMLKCYPTWLPQHLYQNLSTSHETLTHSLQNWTTQAYSFHFTFPEPFFDEKYLVKQTGIAGDVGRHVMHAAGLKLPRNI